MNTNQLNITLALVEDMRLSREGITRILKEMVGVRLLFTAEHGAQLPDKIARHHVPDVILLDAEMPVMNGYKTAAWLRIHHPGIRVLALSGMFSARAPEEMMAAGAHGFVPKGVSPEELEIAIRTVHATGWFTNELVTPRLQWLAQHEKLSTIQKKLTPRRTEALRYLHTDLTYEAIAAEMGISIAGVNKHVTDLYQLFDVHSRVAVVAECFRLGLFADDQ